MRNRKNLIAAVTVAVAVAMQAGCTTPTVATKKAAAPEGIAGIVAGKVVETMDAGPYTYILLEKDSKKSWVAVPTMKVSVGQEVQLQQGVEMGKFTSKTLNRTFDNIIFSSGPLAAEAAAMPPGHPAVEKPAQAPAQSPQNVVEEKKKEMGGHGMSSMMGAQQQGKEKAAAAGNLTGKVVETFDGGGYTYISVEKDGKKTWAAVPVTQVKVGQEVEVQPGMEMTNFKSKTLNRTFESVIFSGGVVTK
jgi:hypothetical protein